MGYVGQAQKALEQGLIHIAAGLYPEGTEFLHTVRYIDVNDRGENSLTPRMKEVRYAKKLSWRNYAQLEEMAAQEMKERHDFPNRIKLIPGNIERGVSNNQGWIFSAFIEDATGALNTAFICTLMVRAMNFERIAKSSILSLMHREM